MRGSRFERPHRRVETPEKGDVTPASKHCPMRSPVDRRIRTTLRGALCLCIGGLGCAEAVEIDAAETALPTVPTAGFDPARSIVPLPNALLIDPVTGRVNVPAGCGEVPGSAAERLRGALNQLDGFGTSRQNLVASFSEPVAPDSLQRRVALVRLAQRGQPVLPPEGPVPVTVLAGSSLQFEPDCSGTYQVPNVTIRPDQPLDEASTYGVLIADGVTTEAGADFQPSVTWALVRQAEPPVVFAEGLDPTAPPIHNSTPFDAAEPEQLASLRGLDLLWRGHAPLLAGLDQLAPLVLPNAVTDRDDILLAWAFTTETLTNPFDPSVAGSPASRIGSEEQPLTVAPAAAGTGAPATVEQFFGAALPGVPCESLGCAAIGAIYAAGPGSVAPSFKSSSYLTGDDCSLVAAAAGAFSDPVAPALTCERQVPLIAFTPLAAPPASGYPTVIFAHGIGRSKEDLFALAGSLASAGFASVAVDALDHGVRAILASSDPVAGCDRAGPDRSCAEVFGPTCAPQCFAPLLSSDLAVTRDHLRQTVLDHLALGKALALCTAPEACGGLLVDPARIGFIGQSLGALIGAVSVANSTDISAAVLNVGGADWLQVLSETDTLGVRCPLVDALIAGGVIPGEPWNLGANQNATCVGDAWKAEPGYQQFASAARWILDPVDAINYASALTLPGAPPVLVGEVVGDSVVPNSATLAFATALELEPSAAVIAASAELQPTPAALAPGSAWIRYQNLDADPASMFPGNAYSHGSLLVPAQSATMVAPSGELGTLRMRVDALAFLASHLGGAP
jgi:dienelactone hydrolase